MIITKTFKDIVKESKISVYQIPAGQLTINDWFAGTQFKANSNLKAILYYVKDGEHYQNTWKILDRVYTYRGNIHREFDEPIIVNSNGTAEIVMKALIQGQIGFREVFMKWVGNLS
jgi:hypothetical protein